MSLAEAVTSIADDMDKEVDDYLAVDTVDSTTAISGILVLLQSYAKMLRMAVKASGGDVMPDIGGGIVTPDGKWHSPGWKPREEREAIGELVDDSGGTAMVELVGCPDDVDGGTMVPINSAMPVGARTVVAGDVYVFQADGKLHWSEEFTKKMREGQK